MQSHHGGSSVRRLVTLSCQDFGTIRGYKVLTQGLLLEEEEDCVQQLDVFGHIVQLRQPLVLLDSSLEIGRASCRERV